MNKLLLVLIGFIIGCFFTKSIITSKIKTHYVESTELDEYLISSVITAECNNCSTKVKYLVGQTVLNRAIKQKSSIIKEVYQKGQYSYKYNFHTTYENSIIAHNIVNNCIPSEYKDNRVTHFYSTSAKFKPWMKNMEVFYFDDNLIVGTILI